MARRKTDPLSMREIRRRIRLEDQSFAAFERGDITRAMDLDDQLAALAASQEADYRRKNPNSPRYRDDG